MAAAVMTTGTLEDAMTLNLWLRTGHRVLYLIDEFRAKNSGELYGCLLGIPWERMIREDDYVTVTATVNNETINDNRFVNVKAKDAIVDRIRKKCGRRPDSGPERSKAVIHVYWQDKEVSVFIDTSGEPLSKRGYRKIPLHAPMQESLAACVVNATAWPAAGDFINPMCGSGTLAIEAALSATRRAPGLTRRNFGFMHLRGFDTSFWKDLREHALSRIDNTFKGRIVATDIRMKAVLAAKKNARAAGVEQNIEFDTCDYSKTEIPGHGGVIVLNPEYGLRLGDVKQLESVYKGIGDFFKQRCQGYRGYIFTGNLDLAKQVGLRTKRRIPFYNGELECRLLEYDLYAGSIKKQAMHNSIR
jgi:putative N6-adenine-specific DNA methylase